MDLKDWVLDVSRRGDGGMKRGEICGVYVKSAPSNNHNGKVTEKPEFTQ